jgi:hypothetical protein
MYPIQLSLLADFPAGNDSQSELGTRIYSVPNSVHNQPCVGCLEQKVIKSKKYWYWRYYTAKGIKRSLYLSIDYHKAIAKAKAMGVPKDAKLPNTATHLKT